MYKKGASYGGDWGWKSDAQPNIPVSESKILKIFNPMFINFWKENLL